MIEPAVRDHPLLAALANPKTGVVLVDLVLGFGAHADPASHLVGCLARAAAARPQVIASVTGTEADPQGLARQCAILATGGVMVARSNAAAVRMALHHVTAPVA
jgi:hypothetical protein